MKNILIIIFVSVLTYHTEAKEKFTKEQVKTSKLEMSFFINPQGTFNSANITVDIKEKATGREAHCELLVPLWKEKPYPLSMYYIIFNTSYYGKKKTTIPFNPRKVSVKKLKAFLAEEIIFSSKSIDLKSNHQK